VGNRGQWKGQYISLYLEKILRNFMMSKCHFHRFFLPPFLSPARSVIIINLFFWPFSPLAFQSIFAYNSSIVLMARNVARSLTFCRPRSGDPPSPCPPLFIRARVDRSRAEEKRVKNAPREFCSHFQPFQHV